MDEGDDIALSRKLTTEYYDAIHVEDGVARGYISWLFLFLFPPPLYIPSEVFHLQKGSPNGKVTIGFP